MNRTRPGHVDDDLKAFLDGELGTVRRLQVARHLAACAMCREKEQEMKQLSEQLRWNTEDDTLSPDLRANLLAQVPQGRASDGPTIQPLWRRSPGLVFGGGGIAVAASFAAFATLYTTANKAPGTPPLQTTEAVASAVTEGQAVTEAAAATEGVAVVAGAAPASTAEGYTVLNEGNANLGSITSATEDSNGAANRALRSDASTAYRISPSPSAKAEMDRIVPPVRLQSPTTGYAQALTNGNSVTRQNLNRFSGVQSTIDIETRQVHREASLGVAVDNPEAASIKVEMQVKEWGGYVASNVLNTDDSGFKSADLTLKVPEERFDEMLASVSKLGDVRFKNLTGEDITEQTSDATSDEQVVRDQIAALEARLKNGNLSERRTVQMEAQLRQTQLQLARTQARLGLLRKLARLSTLSVTLTEKKKVEVTAPPATGFWADMKDSNRSALKAFQAAIRVPLLLAIWLVALSPLWLPLYLIYRQVSRKQAAQDSPRASDK